MSPEFVYLASASPRRRELLAQIGVPFAVVPATVDESPLPGEPAEDYVLRVARAKAAAGEAARPPERPAPVLAADTAVFADGSILGKPRHAEDGRRMLLNLSGRTHEVVTAVALATSKTVECRLCRTRVTFRIVSSDEAVAYWSTGEPQDKAGGYAIQGRAAVFVAALDGSYSGVMGLPLFETAELLSLHGVPRWR